MRLDRGLLKLLASDTRSDILKSLGKRRKTLTELSTELGLAPASVSEHMEKLEAAELVQKIDDGRKWKYYELTKQSRELTGSQTPIFLVITSLAVLLFVGISFMGPAEKTAGSQTPTLLEKSTGESLQTPAIMEDIQGAPTMIGIGTNTCIDNANYTSNSTNCTIAQEAV